MDDQYPLYASYLSDISKTPMPPHGPWPWYHSVDGGDDLDVNDFDGHDLEREGDPAHRETQCREHCLHTDCDIPWEQYPHSVFPRWTPEEVKKTLLRDALVKKGPSESGFQAHWVDVLHSGEFSAPRDLDVPETNLANNWTNVEKERPEDTRVRVLIVDALSGQGMKILGTKYRIGPFFFLSALSRSSSIYQGLPSHGNGHRITIILKFLRTMTIDIHDENNAPMSPLAQSVYDDSRIRISNKRVLCLDLLAVHMIRAGDTGSSTIISFHPCYPWRTGLYDAYQKGLHKRIADSCLSEYHRDMFKNHADPTFVLLLFLWYVVYAWDEALERLYIHIDDLEKTILRKRADKESDRVWEDTNKLYHTRGQLLSYAPLLADLKESVEYIVEKSCPAKDILDDNLERTTLLKEECKCLLREIDRQNKSRDTPDKKLENIMNLVLARGSMTMTETSLNDSYSMMVLSVLAMIFLPASFIASVFGINMKEVNPNMALARYLEIAIPLTAITVFFYMVSHRRSQNHSLNVLSVPRVPTNFFERKQGVAPIEDETDSVELVGTKRSLRSNSPDDPPV